MLITNRLQGWLRTLAYAIREPQCPLCIMHFETLSDSNRAVPEKESLGGAGSLVMKFFELDNVPRSCVSVSTRMSYCNSEQNSRTVCVSPPQFQVASLSSEPRCRYSLFVFGLSGCMFFTARATQSARCSSHTTTRRRIIVVWTSSAPVINN